MSKSLWQEIKEQPDHIREIFMWVCVVAIFSVVGFSWFKSTASDFVALVNPSSVQTDQSALAKDSGQSPFATIFSAFGGLKASMAELFDFAKKTSDIQIRNELPQVEPNLLPLSGDRTKK